MSLGIGIVGCGNISRFHFAALAKQKANVRWICDLNEAAARPRASEFGARMTTDYREALADPAVGVILVTTISRAHKAICLDAIAAGKAVICEKTLAENADDALEIVRAAEKQGTIFYTSYRKRFIPAVERAKELLPALGTIFSTHIRAYQNWGNLWLPNPDPLPPGEISAVRRSYGGGILHCGGSHILDLIGFFLGRPHRLYASVYTPADRDFDIRASALMETVNGIVHFDTVTHPLKHIGFQNDGWDERVEINGTGGRLEVYSAVWDHPEEKASLLVHYDNTTGAATEYHFDPVSPFERALSFFLGNIERGEQGAQSRYTGYDVDELIETMLRSSAQKQALDVNWRIG